MRSRRSPREVRTRAGCAATPLLCAGGGTIQVRRDPRRGLSQESLTVRSRAGVTTPTATPTRRRAPSPRCLSAGAATGTVRVACAATEPWRAGATTPSAHPIRRRVPSRRSPPVASMRAGCAPTPPSSAGATACTSTTTPHRRAPSRRSPPVWYACALRTNATVACWGDNEHGQTDPPAGAFTAITTAGSHSCGLRSNATIACWGDNEHGQTNAPAGTDIAVVAGHSHSCALRSDHTVTCWGAAATDLQGDNP